MSEITWRAHLDKFASEPDLVLEKGGRSLHTKGGQFLLTIGPEKITIKAQGCCAGAPYVLPLSMVKEARMLTSNPYAMPSFVIIGEKMVEAPPDEESGEVPVDADGEPLMVAERFFHKFFIEGHEESIIAACNKVDAQVRLLQGQVLVAGFIDTSVPNVVSYFSPADTIMLFEMESSMMTKAVGESTTLFLEDYGGAVTLTRLPYGTDMLLSKADPDFLPSAVFIERVHAIQFTLPVYEATVKNNAGEEVKAFRVAADKGGSTPAVWKITLDPTVVIAAPYLAGLQRKAPGAARPRTQSFTTNKKPFSGVPMPRLGIKK
jgi:hypothetical protein